MDQPFPTAQFIILGFTLPYLLDRNQYEGGIMLLKDINLEINISSKKWLIYESYTILI